MIDLHMHTTASDGELDPTTLVGQVYAAGIRTFSITDHDTMAGVVEAAQAAAASVLGIDLQDGENIQSGFETYVHDVSNLAKTAEPDNTQLGGSAPLGTESADFSQFGAASRAAVAAAAGAAAWAGRRRAWAR